MHGSGTCIMTTEPEKIEYRKAAAQVTEKVRSSLKAAPEPIKEVAELLAETCGKGARTALLMASAMDDVGCVPPAAVNAASSVELLHMATLVHDDIIDNAELRRGKESVQSRFGKEVAVLGGDWLLTLAVRCALDADYPEEKITQKRGLAYELATSAERILLGEMMQRSHNGNLNLSVIQYIRIIDRKTAALFCLAARAGAEISGCEDKEIRQLVRFSRYLGIVFQMVDDLKDYMLDEGQILKPSRHDLISGVVTLPLILSFAKEPELKSIALDVIKGEADIAALIRRMNNTKGIDAAKTVAESFADKARVIIETFSSPIKRDALSSLLEHSLTFAGVL